MKSENTWHWIIASITLFLSLLVLPQIAVADRTVTSVELDGSATGTVTVTPSATIVVEVFVTTNGGGSNNDWESTSWRIDSGTLNCVDHGDHTFSWNFSETFDINAPATTGGHQLHIIAYRNDNCSSGASNTYTRDIEVESPPPEVTAMSRASFDPTTADSSVSWTVEFSQAVTGVDTSDFFLVEANGTTGATITGVSGSGTTWTVTANTGTSDTGTLGLNLIDNDTIINGSSTSLGGVGSGNGNYVGPVYTLEPPAPTLGKTASTSAAALGDVVTFTITVSNPYSEALDDVVLTDVLPVGMTYVTHVAQVGSVNVSGQTVAWTINTLPATSSVQLTLAVTMSQQGILTNTVTSPGATPESATVLVLGSAVTHFRMDEPTGSWIGDPGEVIDSGGTALHGRWNSSSGASAPVDPGLTIPTISEQHPTVIGDFCNAAEFDGSSVIEVADSSLFDYTTQLSASTWIYPTAYPSDLSSILSNDVNYEFHLNSSGRLYWWWQASTLTSAATIPLNQWTHVAITLDSSSGVRRQRIYINGVQDANTNNWQGTLSTNNCRVHIGGDVDTGSCNVIPGRNFNGMIDEVKLYGFELTQAQVQADMNLGRNCSGSFDHIRIEHDGIGSICAPESVTIKACLDPDCTTLFPGDVTVNLSPSGWVGGNSFMFSGGIASRQLSRGTSGDVTLGTNSVSPTPSSSTQCFNGSTQTCTLNFADVSCAFDAVEPGYSPQSPIFTKLSGVPFDIDVLALLDASTVNTNYVNTVDVDLVDSASSACPAGAGLTTAASLDFVPGDAGRKTVTFDYPGAARNVKVRTRIGASAPACSNDNFAIRPQSFNITSTDATNTATDGTPTIAAGSTFNLTAQALAGYDGTPSVDASLVTGSPNMGTLSGNFNAAAIGSGTASGDFNYSEVGHFGLSENAVYDDDFTLVDHPDDCTNDFSNTLSGGKYGCYIGSPEIPITVGSSGSGFGRFVPDHFVTSVLYNGVFADACSGFTYTGQSFSYDPTSHHPQLEIRAVNSLGATTVNYQGDYVKLTDPATQIDMPPVTSDATQFGADASLVNLIWAPGASALVANGDGTVTFTLGNDQFTYVRDANSLIAPFTSDIRLPINSVTDDDGVSANDLPRSFTPGTTHIRYGRLLLQNAYGPETMDLTIPVLTEYYDGTAFLPNASDNCTPYNASNLLFGVYQAPLAPGDTVASGDGTFVSGTSNNIGTNSFLTLSAPVDGHTGSVELIYDLDAAGLSWLKPGGNNPRAIATFGVFQGNSRLIYMRESIW